MSNIGHLLASHIGPLQRYAKSLTRDQSRADDLLQDCLMRALEKEHLWEPGTDLRAWLFTIMHNQNVNSIRRLVREGLAVPVEEVSGSLPHGPTVEASLELSDAAEAIAGLPRDQREVMVLACRDGQGYDEMAKTLDVPIGTVRSRLSRGRARLREVMAVGADRKLALRRPFRTAAEQLLSLTGGAPPEWAADRARRAVSDRAEPSRERTGSQRLPLAV
jgi:RNA polymerase sigma-70 factor, ECF subfamily